MSVADEFAHEQGLQMCTNRKFKILHRHIPKAPEFLMQKNTMILSESTRFSFLEGHLVSKTTPELDWLVEHGLDWVFFLGFRGGHL